MDKVDKFQNKSASKGNSEDSLLVIYILQILKKYSSPTNHLSSQDVMDHLRKDYSFGDFDEADPKRKEKAAAQQKKVRRLLDTLFESYWNGCIKKEEGKTRNGHKWYYDASKDEMDAQTVQIPETLSDVELDFIIDLIAETKILNAGSTLGIIHKLLRKMALSEEEREQRLKEIKKESWLKNPNDYLLETKELIQEYMDLERRICFDYEGISFASVTPCGWDSFDEKCIFKAKIGGKQHQFLLDKIRNVDEDGCADDEGSEYYNEDNSGNNASLESLFCNLPFIKGAIKEKKEIKFAYRSFVVKNGTVILEDHVKTVLPHSLVFNDGKYYLIGIDHDATDTDRLGYFRVDLIADLEYSKTKIELSDWNAQTYETIQRARLVEKHPLMLAGKEQLVKFLVRESALDRVRAAYGTSPKFFVTKDTSEQKGNENSLETEHPREKLVGFTVRTTHEEAYRWALANADVVELVYPPNLRHKLRRIATPIHKTYVKTTEDKVQLNIDRVFATEIFKIDPRINEEIAIKTFNFLNNDGNNSAVKEIKMYDVNADLTSYVGEFTSAKRLDITKSQCTDPKWIAKLKELVNIHISMTSISDVSWLSELKKLKVVRLIKSPILDLSVLKGHQDILHLELRDLDIRDIGFIENLPRILNLRLSGCPIEDYSPLLRMNSLDYLEIDEKAVNAIGMDNLIKHHPDAVIEIQQKINKRKV